MLSLSFEPKEVLGSIHFEQCSFERAAKALKYEINIPLCNKSTSGEKRKVTYLKPYITRANGLSPKSTTGALRS